VPTSYAQIRQYVTIDGAVMQPGQYTYEKGMSVKLGESTNAVRLERNNFRDAGLLTVKAVGRKVVYRVNDNILFIPNSPNWCQNT